MALIDKLTEIANSIRAKTGGTEPLTLDQMATEIKSISGNEDLFYKRITGQLGEEIVLDEKYTTIGSYSFSGNPNLKKITADYVTSYSASALGSMESVEEVSLNRLVNAKNPNLFYNNKKLKNISLNSLESTGDSFIFGQCIALEELVLPKFKTLGGYAIFQGCTNLKTLVFCGDIVVTLNNIGNIANFSKGTIYVKSALIPEYESATNWSSLVANGTVTFAPIEGSKYE